VSGWEGSPTLILLENTMESKLSPCSFTKQCLTARLKGFLEEDEYISDWIIKNDMLYITISYKSEENNG